MFLPVERQYHATFQHHQHIQRATVPGGSFIRLQHLYIRVCDAHPAREHHLLYFPLQYSTGTRKTRFLRQQRKTVIDPVTLTKVPKLTDGEGAGKTSGCILDGGVVHAVFCTRNGICNVRWVATLPLPAQHNNNNENRYQYGVLRVTPARAVLLCQPQAQILLTSDTATQYFEAGLTLLARRDNNRPLSRPPV